MIFYPFMLLLFGTRVSAKTLLSCEILKQFSKPFSSFIPSPMLSFYIWSSGFPQWYIFNTDIACLCVQLLQALWGFKVLMTVSQDMFLVNLSHLVLWFLKLNLLNIPNPKFLVICTSMMLWSEYIVLAIVMSPISNSLLGNFKSRVFSFLAESVICWFNANFSQINYY